MAKRARGSHRPGQRAPIRRTTRPASAPSGPAAATTSAGAVRPTGGLTAEEEARAAELEARILAEEREAEAIRARGRARAATAEEYVPAPRVAGRPVSGGLAVRYAHEYDYVARDLRRIGALIAVLLGVMVVLWIAVDQMGLFSA